MTKTYEPIDCGIYDEIEVLAMRKTPTEIEFNAEGLDGAEMIRTLKCVVEDVFAKGNEEFIKLSSGDVIRLDRLTKVNGKSLADMCRLPNA